MFNSSHSGTMAVEFCTGFVSRNKIPRESGSFFVFSGESRCERAVSIRHLTFLCIPPHGQLRDYYCYYYNLSCLWDFLHIRLYINWVKAYFPQRFLSSLRI